MTVVHCDYLNIWIKRDRPSEPAQSSSLSGPVSGPLSLRVWLYPRQPERHAGRREGRGDSRLPESGGRQLLRRSLASTSPSLALRECSLTVVTRVHANMHAKPRTTPGRVPGSPEPVPVEFTGGSLGRLLLRVLDLPITELPPLLFDCWGSCMGRVGFPVVPVPVMHRGAFLLPVETHSER